MIAKATQFFIDRSSKSILLLDCNFCTPRFDVIKSSFRPLLDEALRVARGWSEYDSASRNGAEYRFHEYQEAREEQRREYQVSSGVGTGFGPPTAISSVDESSQ